VLASKDPAVDRALARERPAKAPFHAAFKLALCCAFWGLSFPLMQMSADAIARSAAWVDRSFAEDIALRSTYIGWRFGGAGLLYALLTLRSQRRFNEREVRGGIVVGAFFAIGNILQMAGLRYALPSVSAVLTSTVVVFTPFAQYFVLKRRVDARTWQAVALALVGVVVLALPNPAATTAHTLATASPVPLLGEASTLVAAMLFTGQVLGVDHFGKGVDARRFTLVMFATASALTLAIGLLLGGARLHSPATLALLARDARFVQVNVAMLAICSVGAFHLMNTAQPLVSPAVASVIYCLEPVFATVWSVVLGTESLTWLTLAGGGLVILAMVRLARATE
jgi:drug/metabolite transporter (DMT)-like permease